MMIRSRMPSCSAGGIAGFPPVVTAGPGVRWFVTGDTTRIVGAAFPDLPSVAPSRASPRACEGWGRGGPLSAGGLDLHLGDVGGETVAARHQTGDPDQHDTGGRGLL